MLTMMQKLTEILQKMESKTNDAQVREEKVKELAQTKDLNALVTNYSALFKQLYELDLQREKLVELLSLTEDALLANIKANAIQDIETS